MRSRLNLMIIAAIALAAISLSGCGSEANESASAASSGSSSDAGAQAPELPPVPPEQASPEALVAHLKTLLDAKPPKRVKFLTMCQMETPLQVSWSRFIDNVCIPLAELKEAVDEKFPGNSLKQPMPFVNLSIRDAAITKRDGNRAEARMFDRGAQLTLHLMTKYERWWVSGYTFEHAGAATVKEYGGTPERFGQIAISASRSAQGVRDVAQRIRMGEFKNQTEAGRAYMEAVGMSKP